MSLYLLLYNHLLQLCKYRILSKNSSQTVARKIRHLVAITIIMNKMTNSDECLDYLDETLERFVRGAFQDEMEGVELSEASTSDR